MNKQLAMRLDGIQSDLRRLHQLGDGKREPKKRSISNQSISQRRRQEYLDSRAIFIDRFKRNPHANYQLILPQDVDFSAI